MLPWSKGMAGSKRWAWGVRWTWSVQLGVALFSSGVGTVALGQGTTPARPASNTSSHSSPQASLSQHHLQLMQLLEQIPPYRPSKDVQGKATLSGSSTMYDLGHQWALNFKQFHPKVEFTGEANGSEAALKALASDSSVIAGVSRQVDIEDQKLLQTGSCKDPMAIVVATDAMAIYVHKDNPIASKGITPEQLQKIFAAGANGVSSVKNWGELGVTGTLAEAPIHIFDREPGSGSHTFISKTLLGGATTAKAKSTHQSNTDVCKAVSEDVAGIGIGEMSNHQTSIRKVPLILQGQLVMPDEASVLTGKYPLMRPLMLVVDKKQLQGDGGLREAVLQYVLSKDGQTEVMKAGFYPLNPAFIRQQLEAVSGQQLR